MVRPRKKKEDMVVIKKYANRRLYDTSRSHYVTLDDLCDMIKEGQEFIVQDAKSGEELTQQVLTQIIVEQESRGQNILPPTFLRNIIKFYGDNMQGVLPNYLEQAMHSFIDNQDTLRKNIGTLPGASMFEDLNRKNMEMFEQTIKMFTPFSNVFAGADMGNAQPSTQKPVSKQDRIKQIKLTITELQEELRGLIS